MCNCAAFVRESDTCVLCEKCGHPPAKHKRVDQEGSQVSSRSFDVRGGTHPSSTEKRSYAAVTGTVYRYMYGGDILRCIYNIVGFINIATKTPVPLFL